MAKSTNYEIKTTLAIDGEKEFKAAMDDANRSMRVWDADLRAVQAEFKATGDQERYLADKTELLASKVRQQEAVVEALNNAVKEAAQKYGDASKKTDDYRIKLSNATAKMFDLRRESEQANKELEELGKDSGKVGKQIKDGIGDAAEETAEKLDGMFSQVAKDVNALKSSVAFQTTMDIGGAVMNAMQSAISFVQENQEYRRLKSFAEQSALRNDADVALVEEYANEIAVFFGDYDAAVETMAVLTEAGFKGEQLGAAVDNLIGAAIAYYNTLNTESLAESLHETLATGELTGQYAELIDRLQGKTKITAEDLEKQLKKAKTEEEKLELLMAPLTEAGMQTNKVDYETRNQQLVAAARAERELAEAWAELSAQIEPVVTEFIEGTKTLVDGLTEVVKILSDSDFAKKQLNQDYPEFGTALEGGQFDTFGGTLEYFFKNLLPSAGAEELPTADLQNYGFTAAQEIANGMMLASEGETAASAAVKTMISTMSAETIMADAQTSGKNLMINFGNGIAEGMSAPLENVRTMVNQINAMLSQIATPAYGLGWSGISGGNVYLYNQQKNAAGMISKTIGGGVRTKMLKD